MKNSFSPIWNRIPNILKNKYSVAFILFATWMIFFDKYSVVNQVRISSTLNEMREERDELNAKIEKSNDELESLNKFSEKKAREEFNMKKKNETIYIVEEE